MRPPWVTVGCGSNWSKVGLNRPEDGVTVVRVALALREAVRLAVSAGYAEPAGDPYDASYEGRPCPLTARGRPAP